MIKVSRGSQQIRTLDSGLNPRRGYLDAAGERFKQRVLAEPSAEPRHPLLRLLREEEIRNAEQAAQRLPEWHRDKQSPKLPRVVSTVTGRTRPALVARETYEREVHKIKAERLMIDVPRKMEGGTGIGKPQWDKPNTLFGLEANWSNIGRKEANKYRAKNFRYDYPCVKTEPLPESPVWKYQPYVGSELSWKCRHGHGVYTNDRGRPYCTGCQDAPRLKLEHIRNRYLDIIYEIGKKRGFRWNIRDFRQDLIAEMSAYLRQIEGEIAFIAVEHGKHSAFTRGCVRKKLAQYLDKIQKRATDIYTPGRWPNGGGRRVIRGPEGQELPWSQLMTGHNGKLAGEDSSRRHTHAVGTFDEEVEKAEGHDADGPNSDPMTETVLIANETHPRNDFAATVTPRGIHATRNHPVRGTNVGKDFRQSPQGVDGSHAWAGHRHAGTNGAAVLQRCHQAVARIAGRERRKMNWPVFGASRIPSSERRQSIQTISCAG